MSFNTNWDLDYYKTDYESEEHWQLRRRFMEVHKDKFPEDELVCLAQVFTNVEFMGCKYPDETMRMVAELSQEVAGEFREARSSRLKRTFVKASDAAEARAKGTRNVPLISHNNNSNLTKQNPFTGLGTGTGQEMEKHFANLKYGKFVLFWGSDENYNNTLYSSGARSGIPAEVKTVNENTNEIEAKVYIGKQLVASEIGDKLSTAKQAAVKKAIEELQEHCFTIKPRASAERIQITKQNEEIVCHVQGAEEEKKCHIIAPGVEKKITSTSIGYKIMEKMGWSGGGLGLKRDGRKEPIDYLIKNNRYGLGCSMQDKKMLNRKHYEEMLQNYVVSGDIRDLYFDKAFSKDERACLHQIAQNKGLKSVSYGKCADRFLIISKKDHVIMPLTILKESLINKNPRYLNKYEVTVPLSLKSVFSNLEL